MEQIAIPFNRRWLWGAFWMIFGTSMLMLLFAVMTITSVVWGHPKTETYTRILGIVELPLIFFLALICLWLSGVVGRFLWKKTPALILTPEGIVDHSSDFLLGQVRWDEMKQIYPADLPSSSRWIKLKYRVIVIQFKNLRQIQGQLPWWKQLNLRMEPSRNFVCIYQCALSITADEFMTQLNDYYRARVTNGV